VSPVPAGPYLPTGALVAVAWLGQRIDGLSSGMVATKLPRDLSTWAATGFVQASVIPSPGPIDSGDGRLAYVQIDAWGVNVAADGSAGATPALGKATRAAELIMRGLEDDAQVFGGTLAMPAGYDAVRVLSAWPMSEPSPVPDDPSGYGRVTFDLALKWARV
jgi:hypothetical protein